MKESSKYDSWLTDDAIAALVIREPLVPVEGDGGVIFPATFAAAEDKSVFPGGYNIDPPIGAKNVCLVDSVGSQANRLEPIFARRPYAELVPQVDIIAGERSVSLLNAGHRAGDAIVRCTPLQRTIQEAFKELLRGNAKPMAKVAPTSLVFGVWDSRDTQAKTPRLVAATIRAFNVEKLTRSAQFNPTVDYIELGLLEDTTDKKTKDEYAKRGFVHVPATGSHGGVIARGGIRRDITLSLAALRLLAVGDDVEQTLALRRYVLGLALVAVTAPSQTYLRQGCDLVPDADQPRTTTVVSCDGTRSALALRHEDAVAYAKVVAKEFEVGESLSVAFDAELARKDIAGESDVKPTRKRPAKSSVSARA